VSGAETRVWDRPVRLLHWGLVATLVAAWFTGDATSVAHEALGYAALAIVAARLAWSRVGGGHARFGAFLRGPRETLRYARALVAGSSPRYVGHNPLGGWMVVALLATTSAVSVTGALYTTDWLWGYGWLAKLHEALAWLLVALALLNIGGVLHASRQHRENLVAAMVHGRKRAAKGTLESAIHDPTRDAR
jgi:cytochrome b